MAMGSHRLLAYLYNLGKGAFFLGLIITLVHFFVATVFIVDGASMLPNLQSGAIVLINRLIYQVGQPTRGDIVVLRYPGDPTKRIFVKRIIGLPGERIALSDNQILVNNAPLVESYLESVTRPVRHREFIVPVDEYYTLGDNRWASNDSRTFGSTPKRFLVGRVSAIIFPFDQAKIIPKAFY